MAIEIFSNSTDPPNTLGCKSTKSHALGGESDRVNRRLEN